MGTRHGRVRRRPVSLAAQRRAGIT
jgi:hypothetical protein